MEISGPPKMCSEQLSEHNLIQSQSHPAILLQFDNWSLSINLLPLKLSRILYLLTGLVGLRYTCPRDRHILPKYWHYSLVSTTDNLCHLKGLESWVGAYSQASIKALLRSRISFLLCISIFVMYREIKTSKILGVQLAADRKFLCNSRQFYHSNQVKVNCLHLKALEI